MATTVITKSSMVHAGGGYAAVAGSPRVIFTTSASQIAYMTTDGDATSVYSLDSFANLAGNVGTIFVPPSTPVSTDAAASWVFFQNS